MSRPTVTNDPDATAPHGGPAPAAPPGLLAGRYRLGEPLGEGGMGCVYRAEQVEPVRRAVAVKLIRAGRETAGVLRRFEAERQALARMTHPHIARVFDAGTAADGRPFVAMELVDGPPVTDHCDRAGLGRRERLELFRQVCDAVTHAHQKGVIHRDLKPSNILVGPDGPRVIDFGLAKATAGRLTEDTFHTGAGSLLGTPAYMAPEQAWADPDDVDTRADVFALGAVLYELLTGTPPHPREELKGLPLDELVAKVRAADIPPPSRRAAVPRELDWVVLKALARERDRRYGSAAELGEDVRRFLADEPVTARRPTRWYRLRKFVRRHRVGVAAAGLVLALAAVVTWAASERQQRIDGQAFNAELQQDLFSNHGDMAAARASLGLVEGWLDGSLSERHSVPPPGERPVVEQTVPVGVLLAEGCRAARALAERPPAELSQLGLIQEAGLQAKAAEASARFGRFEDALLHARRAVQLGDWQATHFRSRLATGERQYVTVPANQLLGVGEYEYEYISTMARRAALAWYRSLVALAEHQAQAGHTADARATLDAAVAARPDPPARMLIQFDDEHWLLGATRLALGQWADADKHFRIAMPESTNDVDDWRRSFARTDTGSIRRAGWAVSRFGELGQPDLAAKWRAEFARKGWLPELAPPPRPAGVR